MSGDQALNLLADRGVCVKKLVLILMFMVVGGCLESSPKTAKKIPLKAEVPNEISEEASFSKESFQPTLDILFVIDDSGSMGTHQKNLSDNVKLFADAIVKTKFLDYHVGVINSSAASPFGGGDGGGKLFGDPKYVDRTTPDGLDKLEKNLIVGTSGDAREIFFDPLHLALTEPLLNGYNDGFIREDSYLAIIFVTDTDDQSTTMDAQSMYDFLVNFKGSTDKLFVGAAYIPDSAADTCSGESDISYTDNLPDFFKLTKATTFSLCDPDFGEQLAEIGRVLASKSQTMYLKKIPKKGTIKVMVGNQEIPNHPQKGWTYNPVLNAIEFGREINWDIVPENTFPQVDFEAIEIDQPDVAGQTTT